MFVDGPGAGKHIQAGAKKVIITAPAKGADIPTYVVGVNEGDYTHDIANIVRLVLPISNTLLLTAKRPTKKEKKKNCRNKLVALISWTTFSLCSKHHEKQQLVLIKYLCSAIHSIDKNLRALM